MKGFSTQILHSDRLGRETRLGTPEHGALHKPVHNSVAYGYESSQDLLDVFQGKKGGFAYARQANPTVDALEAKIALMEDSTECACFSTGMAAIGAMLQSLLRPGDHVLSSSFLFGNTNSQFLTLKDLGVEVSFFDPSDLNSMSEALQENTRLVFVETIANPGTQVALLDEVGSVCKEKGILYVVDNTMSSPYLVKPKEFGADLIIHSLTKYIGGHGNALGGAIVDTGLFDWSTWPHIYKTYKKFPVAKWGITQIRKKALRDFGAALSPSSAHLLSVGSDTLSLRMKQSGKTALALAMFLEKHPKVSKVLYPGLASHAQHNWMTKNMKGYGSLLSFELVDGTDCLQVLDDLKVAISSSNLGDNRTLVIPVAHTIFFEMGPERRKSMNIGDSMIRVSVGIEEQEDLIDDFKQALL